MSEWSTEYINSLPDEAFAVIEPAYLRGETEDKRCRHLPHHTREVKDGKDSEDHIDIDHLRNAWQRRNQIKPFSDSITQAELRLRAERHLKKHIKDLELDWAENSSVLDLIPGQFSLSKTGEGMVRLSAPIKSACRLSSNDDASPTTQPPVANPEEFVRVRFRALSQIYIEDYYLDFTKPGVLEKAVPLLKHQTVYPDHDVRVGNWLGVVEETYWDAGNPPGIDADLKIDALTNPKIARGLLIQPPAIHSASVTTYFLWSKSHDLPDEEFYSSLGQERDGEVVRIIVDEIISFGELSLVWQGADPFAKRKMSASLKAIKGGLNMSEEQTNPLSVQIESLQKRIAELAPLAELGRQYEKQLREEAESLYRLLNQEHVNEDFIKLMIHQSPIAQLQILKKDYEKRLNEKLSYNCPHCGKVISSLRRSREEEIKYDHKVIEQHKI